MVPWTMHPSAKSVVGILIATALGALFKGPVGAAICLVIALAVWAAFGYSPLRRYLGLPGKPDDAPSKRVGYKGRPGSYGNLERARFSSELDTGIDNEGEVDAPDASFGDKAGERGPWRG
jgi:hypothetical protein